MEAEWPVATRSRRILSELASAFGGAIISPVYDWKQLYRYLESIKSEVDVSIALHEQLLSLTALAHFILITDDMGDSYHSYLRQTTEWISVSASLLSKSVKSLIGGEKNVKVLELIALFFSLSKRLVEEWATVFVQDVYRTHVTPIFSDYLGTKSAEDALETLILLAESFTKVRHFTSVLLAAIAPLNDLLSLESLKHLSCINIKPALTEALKALPVDFKTALFELTFACDALRSDHAQHLYPLEDYFQLIEEPALATFMPKEEGRTFKVLRQACVRLCDESRVFLRINHLERFESLSLDLEHAMRIGSRLHLDDTLDLELTLPKLIFRSDLDRLLEFSEILDETTTFDAENQQEARLAFVRKFLENPRDLAVLLLSAREVGLKPLQEALETTIKLMNSTKSSTEDHGDV